MDLGIKGKRAIILGASKGIGFASASALAAEGVDVVLSGSSMERAEAAAAKITDGKVVPMVGDVSNPDNMNTLYEDAKKALGGPIDILFNNHGGPAVGAALDLDEAELISEFNKMVVSIIRLTGLCVPDMIAQKWGRIIAVGSSGVVQPIPNMVLSNTLRASTVYYMKTLANEVIKDGVTVNIVSPTQVLTDRTRSSAAIKAEKAGISAEEFLANQEKGLPAKRFGDTKEFGGLVAFLCSQYGGYCSGSNWRVDGGMVKSIV
ncbi:MAG: SDR family oxidoreductase [Rhodospirillaceae bacterium]|jgi:3-oxoacyl-[acyl-carrier protein] reductase|nr:SDR family oxidoreductase [Rhodospirillales bacterium]MBT3904074.1 SDR family oxidoreductase [Rhodospirillaceae bacterium]MBT4701000.1 SDR family oxidoreductase [Rhodospirillaceae bacterium]MBT5035526.1 SDR family oxidoreductase [Rhodospirillaceae bacterium]MBT6219276.1 SDR family oxidoreductase [Rhodospirillaceae bacterium]